MNNTFYAFLPIVPQAATAQNKRAMSLPGKGGIRFFHTKAHQQAMDALAKALAPHRPPSAFVGALELWLTLVFPYRKTEKAAIRNAGKLIPHTTRPDIDNLAKGYIDALMHARILAEDGLVASMHLSKWWGPEHLVGITYSLAPIDGVTSMPWPSTFQSANQPISSEPAPPADSADRQTGKTTRQMRIAPQGALYVWCNAHLDYPRRLAERLGRIDLTILSPASVCLETVAGKRVDLVVDHACKWTQGISEAAAYLRQAKVADFRQPGNPA